MKSIAALLVGACSICIFSLNVSALPAALAEKEPSLSAKCAVAMNYDTGELILSKNAFEKRAMASTTKIMTTLLTIEAGELDRKFTVDSMAIRVEGTSMGLKEGYIVTRRALCYGMMLPSGNDAANAAAVSVSGSIPEFVRLMNKRAAEIGMTDTNFVTPSGLDAEGHYSTAYDMALLTREALKNETFRNICSASTMTIDFGNPPVPRTLNNLNKLIDLYDGCIGVKTGFTDNARRCLVSAAQRGGVTVIAVTLNAPNDWDDHGKMLDYSFSKISPRRVTLKSHALEVVGGNTDVVTAVPEKSLTLGLTDLSAEKISVRYFLPDFVYADISKGQELGYAEVYCGDSFIGRVRLLSDANCHRTEGKKGFLDGIISFFTGLFS